jgi:hypothetical protein
MIEKCPIKRLTTREDNHRVLKLDERDCRCSGRRRRHDEGDSGRRRCEAPGEASCAENMNKSKAE